MLHKLIVKTEEPVYVMQFKIREKVNEWLWLGIIQPPRSQFNSPVFLMPKKVRKHKVVQDFCSLKPTHMWTST
jgi:hypothetical protein